MNVERRERWWLVTIPRESAPTSSAMEIPPPDRALAAVASEYGLVVDELHSSEARFYDGKLKVVIRRHQVRQMCPLELLNPMTEHFVKSFAVL